MHILIGILIFIVAPAVVILLTTALLRKHGPSWMIGLDRLLVSLGILAAFCLTPTGGGVAIAAFWTIIGVPVAVAMWAIPCIFLFLAVTRVVYFVLPAKWQARWVISSISALALLAAPPFVVNQHRKAAARAELALDRDLTTQPIPARHLAIAADGAGPNLACDELCQRLLLNDLASTVTVAAYIANVAPNKLVGTRYRFVKVANTQNDVCPDTKTDLTSRSNILFPKPEAGKEPFAPGVLVKLRAAQGDCLIAERNVAVTEADAVVTSGVRRELEKSHTIMHDPIRVSEVAYYTSHGGTFITSFRATYAGYARLTPVPVPARFPSGSRTTKAGFMTSSAYVGKSTRDASNHLFEKLGYDLALHGDTDDHIRSAISVGLSAQQVDPSFAGVAKAYLDRIRRGDLSSRDDQEIALAILQDERIAIDGSWRAVSRLARSDSEFTKRFAALVFARLDRPSYTPQTYLDLGLAISFLPDAAIKPYREQLNRLARDQKKRMPASIALTRLSIFGTHSVPILIWLIDDAHRYANDGGADLHSEIIWAQFYGSVTAAFCLIGPQAASAVPALLERLRNGNLALPDTDWRLVIHTLIAMGADPDQIWPTIQSYGRTREQFDDQVARVDDQVARARSYKSCNS